MAESIFLTYRRTLILGIHVGLWAFALVSAFLLRFEFTIPSRYLPSLWAWVGVLVGARVVAGFVFGTFHGMWRYTGASDLVGLFKATTVSSMAFVAFIALARFDEFPRSIIFIEWMLAMALVGGLRFGIRKLRELAGEIRTRQGKRQRVLIIGAGDAGEMLLRELLKSHASRYTPVGFLDDDPKKRFGRIHGLKVFGAIDKVAETVAKNEIDEIVIAMPSANGRQMRRVLELCQPVKATVRTIPGVDQLIDGKVSLSQVREVAIEDLLGREPVTLDDDLIGASIRDRSVLVSGAGGSIGSELCRQIARYQPSSLILVEQAENNLFEIHRELLKHFPNLALVPCIADVTDATRIDAIFAAHKPHVVFHAAAHKHVPMMEWNPGEAVKNNVGGTRLLAEMADKHSAQRFVMISTDKAVNPTSVMGATKRVAEMFVQALAARSTTKFVTVRFGNVLGSAGSVIPIFKAQIARGGPVSVTHPEMRRYFMTIPEASQLVLQAGAMGEGGEIFVLDMGEPVKIVDLARDLIRLSGFTPGIDIQIEYTGTRPGEKLFEELSVSSENADKTRHPKIFVGRRRPADDDAVVRAIDALVARADGKNAVTLKGEMQSIVPEYTPDIETLASVPPTAVPPVIVENEAEPEAKRAAVIPIRR
jgi:FlaA1/EpsC-like NDP-sugar epimerase